MAQDMSCVYLCGDRSLSDGLKCCTCQNWAHLKCASLGSLKKKERDTVNWICSDCISDFKEMKENIVIMQKRLREFDGLANKIDEAKNEVLTKLEDVVTTERLSYADVIKNPKRVKNLLVVESSTEGAKVCEKRSEVGEALNGLQVTDSKFSDKKIVLNFKTRDERDKAALQVKNVPDLKVKEVKKRNPCIMLCNVGMAESKDEIIKNLIERNEYLKVIPDIEKKIEYVFDKQAAGNTRHYVLRCLPEVRKSIRINGDTVLLPWGVIGVRDRYLTTTCFYCQRYGHIEAKCPAKEKNELPTCGLCAGNHRSKECNRDQNVRKCINCVTHKREDTDHFVNQRCCESLNAEIRKIKEITENGY